LLVHRIAKVVSGLHQRRAGNDREPLELGWADASEAFRDVGGRPGSESFGAWSHAEIKSSGRTDQKQACFET